MKNCSKDVLKYHADEVTLPPKVQGELRGNRNANRDRLKRGLEKEDHAQPDYFIIQGSYAMKTMKQHPKNDYDIDDGALFAASKLTHHDGTALTPSEAKNRVRDALIAGGGLPATPIVKDNCVRINYAAGHHIDVPVYRAVTDAFGREKREFASASDWKESNPSEITEWFRSSEKNTQSEEDSEPQLRRLTRLLKMYSSNNLGDKALSGLLLTVLAAEVHLVYDNREDRAFRQLLQKVENRLKNNKKIYNPASRNEELTKSKDDQKIDKFIEKIGESLSDLAILDDPECSQLESRKAWDKVFKSEFFSKLQLDEQANKMPATPSNSYPDKRVNIQGPGTSA
jgi:hypothetical protein